jgi:hypothetical protein
MTELLCTGESVCRLDRRKLVIRNVRLQRPQMEAKLSANHEGRQMPARRDCRYQCINDAVVG